MRRLATSQNLNLTLFYSL